MDVRKYRDVVFHKLILIFHFLQCHFLQPPLLIAHKRIKSGLTIFAEKHSSIQTISYRMKRMEKEEVSKFVKKLIRSVFGGG